MTRSIPEIIEEWELGMITTHEVYPALLNIALEVRLEDVVIATPEPWRTRFVDWLKQTYDNAIPAEEFVWLSSSAPEPADARKVITIAREWIGRPAPRPA